MTEPKVGAINQLSGPNPHANPPYGDYRIPDPTAFTAGEGARQAQALERIADVMEDELELHLAELRSPGRPSVGTVARRIQERRGW